MSSTENKEDLPFGETFWKEEGGDKWVENIDLLERQLGPLTEILMQRCAVSPGERVLDVGCGGGPTSITLAEQVGASGHVLGVDISETILEVAKQRGEGISNLAFRVADSGREDLEYGAYDLVFSRFGVMFFGRPLDAFRNLRGHLRPDGRMVFMCWRTLEENPWMTVPAEAAFTVLPRPEPPAEEPDPDAPGPFSLGQRERLEYLLIAAGFRAIHLEAVDTGMQMGNLDEAGHMATQLGPAAKVIQEADEKEQQAAVAAIKKALREYETRGGVIVPSAAWIATAGI
ncbi:MAG: class I SAM-dependent methyltransferase [Gammaproteobacteria bacterium]